MIVNIFAFVQWQSSFLKEHFNLVRIVSCHSFGVLGALSDLFLAEHLHHRWGSFHRSLEEMNFSRDFLLRCRTLSRLGRFSSGL